MLHTNEKKNVSIGTMQQLIFGITTSNILHNSKHPTLHSCTLVLGFSYQDPRELLPAHSFYTISSIKFSSICGQRWMPSLGFEE
uniref:Uncharacterized protein n=1 Tax=Arundo donax TaxID=35708 RepID=A0A0A9FTR3_ARUDO